MPSGAAAPRSRASRGPAAALPPAGLRPPAPRTPAHGGEEKSGGFEIPEPLSAVPNPAARAKGTVSTEGCPGRAGETLSRGASPPAPPGMQPKHPGQGTQHRGSRETPRLRCRRDRCYPRGSSRSRAQGLGTRTRRCLREEPKQPGQSHPCGSGLGGDTGTVMLRQGAALGGRSPEGHAETCSLQRSGAKKALRTLRRVWLIGTPLAQTLTSS